MYICFLAIFFQPSLVSGRFFQVLFLEQKSLQVEGMFFPDTGITGQPVHIFQLEFFFLLIFTWKIRLKSIFLNIEYLCILRQTPSMSSEVFLSMLPKVAV